MTPPNPEQPLITKNIEAQIYREKVILELEQIRKDRINREKAKKKQKKTTRIPFEDLSQIQANQQNTDFLNQSFERTSDEKMKYYVDSPDQEPKRLKRTRSSKKIRRITPILELYDKIYKVVVQQHKVGIHQDDPVIPAPVEIESVPEVDNSEPADSRLDLLQDQVRAQIDRDENRQLYLESTSTSQKVNPQSLQRLHSWLQKNNIEYRNYKMYVNSGKRLGKKFISTTNMQFNMTQYLCALRSFQLKNNDLDDHELIRKWIHLSNKQIEKQFMDGLPLLYELESKYKRKQLDKKKALFMMTKGSNRRNEPDLSFLNEGQFFFDLSMLLEVIDTN